MYNYLLSILAFLVLFHPAPVGAAAEEDARALDPASVIVLANADLNDSIAVAEKFMRLRNIPDRNLIALPMSLEERVSRDYFNKSIHNPLLKALIDRELINAMESNLDSLGRLEVTLLENDLRVLVTCYGVPVHVTNAPVEDLEFRNSTLGRNSSLHEQIKGGPLAKSEASVDGELTVLLRNEMPLKGFIPNPFFRNDPNIPTQDILKVTRLDGPSARHVLRMLDRTIEAERTGLKGRAYIDEDGRGGNFQQGNDWLKDTANIFTQLNFDLAHNKGRRTFDATDRFDEPALYAGWYARSLNGPFALPGFSFPQGAIAMHLHSFSAQPLRHERQGWVGPFVSRGVSATVGNTAEPFLMLTHHFNFLFSGLAAGLPWVDAAYLAQPALSWQNVVIGDPFYRPFQHSLDAQIEELGNPINALTDQYVVMRQVNQLLAANDPANARQVAQRGLFKAPGPALALQYAQLLLLQNDREAALRALSILKNLEPSSPADVGLYAEVAANFHQLGDNDTAAVYFKRLLDLTNLPKQVRIFLLQKGIPIADSSRHTELGRSWRTQLAELTQPKPSE